MPKVTQYWVFVWLRCRKLSLILHIVNDTVYTDTCFWSGTARTTKTRQHSRADEVISKQHTHRHKRAAVSLVWFVKDHLTTCGLKVTSHSRSVSLSVSARNSIFCVGAEQKVVLVVCKGEGRTVVSLPRLEELHRDLYRRVVFHSRCLRDTPTLCRRSVFATVSTGRGENWSAPFCGFDSLWFVEN